jgi:hypothetical protein
VGSETAAAPVDSAAASGSDVAVSTAASEIADGAGVALVVLDGGVGALLQPQAITHVRKNAALPFSFMGCDILSGVRNQPEALSECPAGVVSGSL